MGEIINRVANSGLVDFDLEKFYNVGERKELDISPFLWQGIVLKEKEFRQKVKELEVEKYKGCFVAVGCSTDAIVPIWAYMLITERFYGIAKKVVLGGLEGLERELFVEALLQVDWSEYKDKRVIIKGCGKYPVPDMAYVYVVEKLLPFAKSIMYGEACSTVPVFKRK